MTQGCEATNFRCTSSRRRLGSAIASWLLSILPESRLDAAGAKGGCHRLAFTCVRLAAAKQFGHRTLMPSTVVMRRPRNWRRVVRVRAKPRLAQRTCDRWLGLQVFESNIFVLAIELKSEWFAKGRQCPFRRVGLGRLQRDVMRLAGGIATTFARSMPLPHNRRSISLNGDAHLGDIDGQE